MLQVAPLDPEPRAGAAIDAATSRLWKVLEEVHEADFLAIGRLSAFEGSGSTQPSTLQPAAQQASLVVEAAFLTPVEPFLRMVHMAYGVCHPCGPLWRNRFFASLLEPTEYDAANEAPSGYSS